MPNDGLTYIALCVKFPKGIPIGTLITLETALRTLGTERVSTPSVTPKVMYGIGVTDTLVAAQMKVTAIIKEKSISYTRDTYTQCRASRSEFLRLRSLLL